MWNISVILSCAALSRPPSSLKCKSTSSLLSKRPRLSFTAGTKTVSMSMPNPTFAIHALSLNTLAVTSAGRHRPETDWFLWRQFRHFPFLSRLRWRYTLFHSLPPILPWFFLQSVLPGRKRLHEDFSPILKSHISIGQVSIPHNFWLLLQAVSSHLPAGFWDRLCSFW